jgi:hypothetical protein
VERERGELKFLRGREIVRFYIAMRCKGEQLMNRSCTNRSSCYTNRSRSWRNRLLKKWDLHATLAEQTRVRGKVVFKMSIRIINADFPTHELPKKMMRKNKKKMYGTVKRINLRYEYNKLMFTASKGHWYHLN